VLGDVTIYKADLDEARWTFSTPAGANMVCATLWREGDADGGAGFNATYELWLAGPGEPSPARSPVPGRGAHKLVRRFRFLRGRCSRGAMKGGSYPSGSQVPAGAVAP